MDENKFIEATSVICKTEGRPLDIQIQTKSLAAHKEMCAAGVCELHTFGSNTQDSTGEKNYLVRGAFIDAVLIPKSTFSRFVEETAIYFVDLGLAVPDTFLSIIKHNSLDIDVHVSRLIYERTMAALDDITDSNIRDNWMTLIFALPNEDEVRERQAQLQGWGDGDESDLYD